MFQKGQMDATTAMQMLSQAAATSTAVVPASSETKENQNSKKRPCPENKEHNDSDLEKDEQAIIDDIDQAASCLDAKLIFVQILIKQIS